MTKQEEIYVPMLHNFCAQFKNCYVSDLYGLFLPNTAPKYNEINPKFFYIGKETKGWYPNFEKMLDFCLTNNTIKYIREQNKWLNPDNILNEAKNPFWNTIIKLHIYLHTNKPVTDLRKLDKNQLELLNTIGWGNLNSIITKDGLKQYAKEGEDDYNWWEEDIDHDLYDKIKNASYVFDKLKFVLDIYNPDIIFIFNENKNEEKHYEQFLDGLKLIWCPETKIYDDFLASYSIEDYSAKIIWTAHPRMLAQKAGSMEGAIDKIKNAYDILMQNMDKKMKKLELEEMGFSHIFDLSPVSDIILDKENKVFQVIFHDSPIVEMFLRRKFKNNSIVFYAHGWDNVSITSCNKKTNETTEIDTVEKTKFLVFTKTESKDKIFWGPSVETGKTIKFAFVNLLSYAFYEME